MTARVVQGIWEPLLGSLPVHVDSETVYLLPTRGVNKEMNRSFPQYTDEVRDVPKQARAAGVPLEFAMPPEQRNFLSEYSIDPEVLSIAIAVGSMANSWLISVVGLFISSRRRSHGWSEEQAQAQPMKVQVARVTSNGETAETYSIEGTGAEVIEAIRVIQDQENGDDSGAVDA